jgi:hypothetical protein
MGTVKSQPNSAAPAKPSSQDKLKSGLPGTPEERRRQIREAMKKNAETLRRLAE